MDFYVGEIRIFAGAFAPANWHFCDGSLVSIQNYQALYSLIGVTYGGDGKTNFALPDFRSRIPVGMFSSSSVPLAAGLTSYSLQNTGGAEGVTLTEANIPNHTHPYNASAVTTAATATSPVNALFGTVPQNAAKTGGELYVETTTAGYAARYFHPSALSTAAVGNPTHENRMPTRALNFIIALNGTYPMRAN